jgi:POT family proton-dependent oligopeptide transporter
MWERFSYYGLRPLLILFMSAALIDGGFGFDVGEASAIVGIYAASVYLTSLPGGWIADRWLGLRSAVWYGGLLIALGHLAVALSGMLGRPMFFIGLIFIVCGTGLLKPNISAMVGDLYPEKGARRDAGFSIFYMGINLGATLGPLIAGGLRTQFGWHWGFGAAGVGMLAGVVTYRLRAGGTLGPIGTRINDNAGQRRTVKLAVGGFIVAMAAVYFIYLFGFAKLNGDEKKRVVVIAVLFLFAAIFWAGFEQAPSSLNIFARDFTERHIFGYEIPPEWLQVVNSLFVVLLAPVFAWIWTTLGDRGIVPSSPTKFAAGLFFAGLGFLVMVPAVYTVVNSNGAVKVSMLFLIVSYILQTFGELSLSPVGLSSMTKLAPERFSGQMMGVWFLAASLGNLLAGIAGGGVDPEKLELMPRVFNQTVISLFVATVVLALMVKPIKNMMKNSSVAEGH